MLRASVAPQLRSRCLKIERWQASAMRTASITTSSINRQQNALVASGKSQVPKLELEGGIPLPRALQAIYFQPLRRQPEYGVPVCDLQLRGFNIRNLEFFCDFAMRAAYYLNIPAALVPLPRRTERWTVPKSNFVHKKSQQNFERVTYRRLIQLKDASPESIELWLAFLSKHEFHGIGVKANVWTFEGMSTKGRHDISTKQTTDDPAKPKWARRNPNKLYKVIKDLMKDTIPPVEGGLSGSSAGVVEASSEAASTMDAVPTNTTETTASVDENPSSPVVKHEAESPLEAKPSEEASKEIAKENEPQEETRIGTGSPENKTAEVITEEARPERTEKQLGKEQHKNETTAPNPVEPPTLQPELSHPGTTSSSVIKSEKDEPPPPEPTASEDAVAADRADVSPEVLQETTPDTAKEVEIKVSANATSASSSSVDSKTSISDSESTKSPAPDPTPSEEVVAAEHIAAATETIKDDKLLAKEVQMDLNLKSKSEKPPSETVQSSVKKSQQGSSALAGGIPAPEPTLSEEIVAADHVTESPTDIKEPMLAKEVQINEGLDIEVERIAVTTPDQLAKVDIYTARRAEKILSEAPTESEEIVTAEASRTPLPIPNPTESEEIIKVIIESPPVSAGWPDGMSVPIAPPAEPAPKIKTTPEDAAGAAVQSDGLPMEGVGEANPALAPKPAGVQTPKDNSTEVTTEESPNKDQK